MAEAIWGTMIAAEPRKRVRSEGFIVRFVLVVDSGSVVVERL